MGAPPACLPVAQDDALGLRRGNGELEGGVEVVLLLVRPVNNLATPDHQEARVTQVRCVQAVATSVQHHDAGCAATYKQHGHPLTVSPGLLSISTGSSSDRNLSFTQVHPSLPHTREPRGGLRY